VRADLFCVDVRLWPVTATAPRRPNGRTQFIADVQPGTLDGPLVAATALDAIARARLSTVYMPGRKITMLPEQVVQAFTLAEGRSVPALSLYAELAPDGRRVGHTTRVERVPIAANLRLDAIGEAFANERPAPDEPPWTEELRALWQFAQGLSGDRGKAEFTRIDYSFYVDWNGFQICGLVELGLSLRWINSQFDEQLAFLNSFRGVQLHLNGRKRKNIQCSSECKSNHKMSKNSSNPSD
jgi:exoribonuclease II